jgi:hypothetical protein
MVTMVPRTCELCGDYFERPLGQVNAGNARFCGRICGYKGRASGRVKNTRDCLVCGRSFETTPSSKRVYCSADCRKTVPNHRKTHGASKSRLYNIWSDMKARCNGTAGANASKYYSERSIAVAEAWAASFVEFRDWALSNGYKPTLEIDRIDNDGNYCPENCRWVNRGQQMANTRKRCDGLSSQFKGVSWCRVTGKWKVQMQRNGRKRYIGVFRDEIDAAVAYDDSVYRASKEFAFLNFPERYRQGGVLS